MMLSNLSFPNLISTVGSLLLRNSVRHASKKSGTSTANVGGRVRPKHRGIRYNDGREVQAGTMLVLQRNLRFHPGLHVGFGRNGTLFALEQGTVVVSCEKMDPNWNHTWVQRFYGSRKGQTIYKKFFNIIPKPQHNRFKLVESI
ncbi:hypothetical protein ACI65C_001735 [Semiaphis heraclei]